MEKICRSIFLININMKILKKTITGIQQHMKSIIQCCLSEIYARNQGWFKTCKKNQVIVSQIMERQNKGETHT
jgi:hypothetical protein